jgi:hypothetical protein
MHGEIFVEANHKFENKRKLCVEGGIPQIKDNISQFGQTHGIDAYIHSLERAWKLTHVQWLKISCSSGRRSDLGATFYQLI